DFRDPTRYGTSTPRAASGRTARNTHISYTDISDLLGHTRVAKQPVHVCSRHQAADPRTRRPASVRGHTASVTAECVQKKAILADIRWPLLAQPVARQPLLGLSSTHGKYRERGLESRTCGTWIPLPSRTR